MQLASEVLALEVCSAELLTGLKRHVRPRAERMHPKVHSAVARISVTLRRHERVITPFLTENANPVREPQLGVEGLGADVLDERPPIRTRIADRARRNAGDATRVVGTGLVVETIAVVVPRRRAQLLVRRAVLVAVRILAARAGVDLVHPPRRRIRVRHTIGRATKVIVSHSGVVDRNRRRSDTDRVGGQARCRRTGTPTRRLVLQIRRTPTAVRDCRRGADASRLIEPTNPAVCRIVGARHRHARSHLTGIERPRAIGVNEAIDTEVVRLITARRAGALRHVDRATRVVRQAHLLTVAELIVVAVRVGGTRYATITRLVTHRCCTGAHRGRSRRLTGARDALLHSVAKLPILALHVVDALTASSGRTGGRGANLTAGARLGPGATATRRNGAVGHRHASVVHRDVVGALIVVVAVKRHAAIVDRIHSVHDALLIRAALGGLGGHGALDAVTGGGHAGRLRADQVVLTRRRIRVAVATVGNRIVTALAVADRSPPGAGVAVIAGAGGAKVAPGDALVDLAVAVVVATVAQRFGELSTDVAAQAIAISGSERKFTRADREVGALLPECTFETTAGHLISMLLTESDREHAHGRRVVDLTEATEFDLRQAVGHLGTVLEDHLENGRVVDLVDRGHARLVG